MGGEGCVGNDANASTDAAAALDLVLSFFSPLSPPQSSHLSSIASPSSQPASSTSSSSSLLLPLGGTASDVLTLAMQSRPRDRDAEELAEKLKGVKEQLNGAVQENSFLKAQMQRLLQQLRKKDDQHRQLLAMKADAASDAGADAVVIGQIRELRGEMTAIARVTDKFRDLERAAHERDEEIRRMRAKQSYTQVQEVQIEAQTYYNELRRTRKQVAALQNQVKALQHQRALDAAMWHQQQHQQQQSSMPTSPVGVAYDQQLFLKLRQEVEFLRNENIRLAAGAAVGEKANGGASGHGQRGVHLLHDIAQLRHESPPHPMDDDGEPAADAPASTAYEYEDDLHSYQSSSAPAADSRPSTAGAGKTVAFRDEAEEEDPHAATFAGDEGYSDV